MRTVWAAISGDYQPMGDPAEADCVIAQSFGAREHKTDPGCVNEALAWFIVGHEVASSLPLLLQQEVAEAMPDHSPAPALLIKGDPSSIKGEGLDSWGVFQQAGSHMQEQGLRRPLLVAQAFHVGRVSLQAQKQGIDVIVPAGLPRQFDPESIQPWTRRRSLWAPRELLGMLYLKRQGKL